VPPAPPRPTAESAVLPPPPRPTAESAVPPAPPRPTAESAALPPPPRPTAESAVPPPEPRVSAERIELLSDDFRTDARKVLISTAKTGPASDAVITGSRGERSLLLRLVAGVESLNETLRHHRPSGVAEAATSRVSAAVSLLEFTQHQSAALRERRERLERAHLKQLAGDSTSRRGNFLYHLS
jgi:type IV secretory pathway VirB10-like protein